MSYHAILTLLSNRKNCDYKSNPANNTEVTYRYLLHLLLHSVDCGGRCGESLDGLTGWGQDTLVLNGHWLELW